MGKYLNKLISISSPALCQSEPKLSEELLSKARDLGVELTYLLLLKNGFYAFESALHVLPSNCPTYVIDIERWNQFELWKKDYGSFVEDYLFFAEDIFGEQFALFDNCIYRFDPEIGEFDEFANSFEEWAEKIMTDYEVETGYPLAAEWQELNRPLDFGERLLPKILFILGGEYEVENLYALDAVKGMRFRADMWKQIKDLPEGAEVEIKVINVPDKD